MEVTSASDGLRQSVLTVAQASRRRRTGAGLLAALGVAGCVAALGLALDEPGNAWLRGAIAGLLAVACVMVTGSGPRAAARRLDRVSGARGEIITAWDLDDGRGAGGGPWIGVLAARAAKSASVADWSLAAPGVPAALYAAPLAGVVALAVVLDFRPQANRRPVAPQTGAVADQDKWGSGAEAPDGVLATALAHAARHAVTPPATDDGGADGRGDATAFVTPGASDRADPTEAAGQEGRGRAIWIAPRMEGVVERYFRARKAGR